MKKILIIVGIVVAVLIVVLIALPFLIDVNRFKPTLETDLSTALGRKVQIGEISLALLSGGVTVDNVVIADDPAFSNTPFLQAKQLTAGVALMPLIFSKKLEVSSFTVTEPQVSLLRSASGAWNFATMGGGAKSKSDPSSATGFSVEKLKIANGTIVVGTAGARGKTQTYQSVDFEASDLSYTSQFPFKFSAKTPGNGTVSLDGKAGPINAADASLTPLDAKISAENVDVAATGFVDPSSGVSGVVDFTGDLASDGQQITSNGTVKASKLKLVAAGSPANVPVNVDYNTSYDLKHSTGNLKQGDIHVGKALARLTGAYNAAGATAVIQMKLNGQGMPVADLEGILPAAGITLPSGASIRSGSLNVNLALSGPVDKLVIVGPVNLSNATLAGYNLKSKLGALSSFTGMGGGNSSDTEIQTLSTDLRVDPSGTQVNNLNIVVPSIGTVTGNGTVSADKKLNFKMSAKLATSGVGGIATGAMTSALTGFGGGGKSSGNGAIPFSITGTTSNPVFVPDVAGMAGSMAKGAAGMPVNGAGAAAGAATGALGGLFGKKSK